MGNKFLDLFNTKKPVIGMIHLKGNNDEEVFEIAKKEIDDYYNNGVDAVIVENYFGTYHNMLPVLEYLQENFKDHIYGVNCLYMNTMTFELAIKYDADFVQIDAISGHVIEREDISYAEFIKLYRSRYSGAVIGGVRFKHCPYLSGRTLEEDLKIAMTRCDAIAVSQDETGQETSMDKIQEFRNIIGDFPLIVGAGMTAENCKKQFTVADGGIVGSYFKDTYEATGIVDSEHVKKLIHNRDEFVKGEQR